MSGSFDSSYGYGSSNPTITYVTNPDGTVSTVGGNAAGSTGGGGNTGTATGPDYQRAAHDMTLAQQLHSQPQTDAVVRQEKQLCADLVSALDAGVHTQDPMSESRAADDLYLRMFGGGSSDGSSGFQPLSSSMFNPHGTTSSSDDESAYERGLAAGYSLGLGNNNGNNNNNNNNGHGYNNGDNNNNGGGYNNGNSNNNGGGCNNGNNNNNGGGYNSGNNNNNGGGYNNGNSGNNGGGNNNNGNVNGPDTYIHQNSAGWQMAYGKQIFMANDGNGNTISRGFSGAGDKAQVSGEEVDVHLAGAQQDLQQWRDPKTGAVTAIASHNNGTTVVIQNGEVYAYSQNSNDKKDLGKASDSATWQKLYDTAQADPRAASAQSISNLHDLYSLTRDGKDITNMSQVSSFGSSLLGEFRPGGLAGSAPIPTDPKSSNKESGNLTYGTTMESGNGITADGRAYNLLANRQTGDYLYKFSDGSTKIVRGSVSINVDGKTGDVTLTDGKTTTKIGTLQNGQFGSDLQNTLIGLIKNGTVSQDMVDDLVQGVSSPYHTPADASNPLASST